MPTVNLFNKIVKLVDTTGLGSATVHPYYFVLTVRLPLEKCACAEWDMLTSSSLASCSTSPTCNGAEWLHSSRMVRLVHVACSILMVTELLQPSLL